MSQQINLYNPQFEYQRQILTATSMAAIMGLVAAGLVALTALAEVRTARVQAEATAAAGRLESLQKRQAAVNLEFAPRALDADTAAALRQAELEHGALRHVNEMIDGGELGDTRGYAETFRALARQSVDGLWLTGVGVGSAGADIAVRGRTLDPALVPGYLARLRNEPALQGKAIGSVQIAQAQPVKVRNAEGKDVDAPAPYIEFSLQSTAPAGAVGVQP